MRALKFLIGILLLPLCHAVTMTLYFLLRELRPDSVNEISRSGWGLAIGFILWIFLFLGMPRPVRTYVLGHELTHALWGMVMGARVSKLQVGKKGGSVRLSKTNFLITLAPYFFPFYTVLVLLLFGLLSAFFDMRHYQPFWMGLLGVSWSFHLTFTIVMLMQHQTDVQEHGRLFSYAFIYVANLAGLCLWIVAAGDPTLDILDQLFRRECLAVWDIMEGWLNTARNLFG